MKFKWAPKKRNSVKGERGKKAMGRREIVDAMKAMRGMGEAVSRVRRRTPGGTTGNKTALP